MKKIFYIIALFGMLIGISACKTEHTHNIVSYEEKEPTCTESGHKAYEECTECDYTTYEEISALGHNLIHYDLVESTCEATGKKEHWYCTECWLYFADAEGKITVSEEELVIELAEHNLHHYDIVEPTCEQTGKKEYWYCTKCGTYFTDQEGKNVIAYDDLIIDQLEHSDENNDYLCDYDCGEVLLTKETLQKIIEETLASTKVMVNEWYVPTDTNTFYYFDDNLLYINVDEGDNEKYYYTEEDTTYLLIKSATWIREIATEKINFIISYLFEGVFNLEIASDIEGEICGHGPLEGKTIFYYNNSLGTKVAVSLNKDNALINGMYIYDEYGNYIYTYEFIYGENESVINGLNSAKDSLYTYKYIETTNTYLVNSSEGILDAIESAETTGVEENPATIRLLNDIEVEEVHYEFENAMYAILINSAVINIDLNGYQLSATNEPYSVIQIGSEWGETCDAVVTIEDNSVNQTGKILGSRKVITNNGGTLIFNSGTIEVNSTKEFNSATGIDFYFGSVTMNGGIINVSGISESYLSSGIYEDGPGGTFNMNGGYIKVNSPIADALHLRGTAYINGGKMESSNNHLSGSKSQTKIYLGTDSEGIGATFVGGIKSYFTLNSLLSEGVGYYNANGNLIEVTDDVTEILDQGDITIKRNN